MPAVRALSGQIAKMFGRDESIGFALTRGLQMRGKVAKGHGGGWGAAAPAGRSADAVALFLAMSAADCGPSAALDYALNLYRLPYVNTAARPFEGGKVTPLDTPPLGPRKFGAHLARLVQSYRAPGLWPPEQLSADKFLFGVQEGLLLGEVWWPPMPLMGGAMVGNVIITHATPAPKDLMRPFSVLDARGYSGHALRVLADMLGPLPEISGDGGDDLDLSGEEDDGAVLPGEAVPLAAHSADEPAAMRH